MHLHKHPKYITPHDTPKLNPLIILQHSLSLKLNNIPIWDNNSLMHPQCYPRTLKVKNGIIMPVNNEREIIVPEQIQSVISILSHYNYDRQLLGLILRIRFVLVLLIIHLMILRGI
jgi:hypothetical protein